MRGGRQLDAAINGAALGLLHPNWLLINYAGWTVINDVIVACLLPSGLVYFRRLRILVSVSGQRVWACDTCPKQHMNFVITYGVNDPSLGFLAPF